MMIFRQVRHSILQLSRFRQLLSPSAPACQFFEEKHVMSLSFLLPFHSPRFMHTTVQCQAKRENKNKKNTSTKLKDEQDAPSSLDDVVNIDELKATFSEVLVQLRDEYLTKLSLRTNQASFSNLPVSIGSGQTVNLQYIAQVSMKPPNTIHVNLSSHPQYVTNVRNELQNSALNVNPRIDGTSIFIETPKVTREHREKLSKVAKTISDQYKVKVRDVQNAKLKALKRAKDHFGADDVRKLEKRILEVAKLNSQQIDETLKQKQKELLTAG